VVTVGLDIGSLSTKAIVLNGKNNILSYIIKLTSGDSKKAAEEVFDEALKKARVSKEDINYTVATGYGRDNVSFAEKTVTEITCHALGAYFIFPETRTVIDIGGQDSKVIKLSDEGKVSDFAMNDKCAAGTGRFLEVMAQAMGVKLIDLGKFSSQSKKLIPISSMCTVFAESEVVSLVAEGCPKPDIIRGIHEAIAERILTLLKRIAIGEHVVMTGGVAKNEGVVHALESKLKLKINISAEPQIIGALGAALIAKRLMSKYISEVA